ncbi:purine-cytosine permease family protein [Evansella clarkii]|uniref:purine-cytosine permease family protein n=1 Tax=Evansella clarkii TaxID=79879 RepID=UPI000B44447A|nr:cytosine permease [Evansella clarkii]
MKENELAAEKKEHFIERLGLEAVPVSMRSTTAFDYIKIQTAVSVNAGNFLVPALAVLEGGLTFLQAVSSVVAGAVAAFFFVSLLSLPGSVYGFPAQFSVRMILGTKGAMYLSSPVRALTSLYWFSVQTIGGAYIVQEILRRIFQIELPFLLISVFLAMVMAYLALVGFNAIKTFTSYFTPVLLLGATVMLFVYFTGGTGVGGQPLEILSASGTGSAGTMFFFASLAFVQYISGVSASSDLARYGKTPRGAFTGIFIGNTAGFFCTAVLGAYTAAVSGHWNPFLITSRMTDSVLFLIIIFAAAIGSMVSININNAYSGGFSLLNSVPRLGRVKSALIFGAAGVMLSTYPAIVDEASSFISALGMLIIPLSGVIVADFLLIKKRKFSEADLQKLAENSIELNRNALYSGGFGLLVYMLLPADYSPGFIAFALSAAAYYVLSKNRIVRL